MTATKQLMTAADLLDMPGDGFRYELVRGELRKTPPAGHHHGRIAVSIAAQLQMHTKANELGATYAAETGFLLASNPDHVRAPDVAFVRQERADAADTERFFLGAPDLAIEVISPSDRYSEVEEKVADWLASGTLAVVVIDPHRRTAKVHRPTMGADDLTEADTLDLSDVVPGWQMPVKDIFE